MIFWIFWSLWLCASATSLHTPVGRVPSTEDSDDAASRALEAAIMGLPNDIVSNSTQQHKLAEAEDAVLAQPLKLRKKPKELPSRQLQKPQPMSQHLKVVSKKQYPVYAPTYYPPATYAPPAYSSTQAPIAPSVATVAPTGPVAAAVTAAPPLAAADLSTWKMQMESKLHQGLSSEIKILNTLMAHQTMTHKQLLRFKQVLTVLGTKYKAKETVTLQQQAKIQSLEAQVAAMSQQVHTLNAKFSAYKQQYEEKWQGSQSSIEQLYKKTSDALGAMSAVHDGVQKELNAMKVSPTMVANATVASTVPPPPPSMSAPYR